MQALIQIQMVRLHLLLKITNLKWIMSKLRGRFYAKLSDWGISDTLDINQLAIAVGYGNIETKYTVSPTKLKSNFQFQFQLVINVVEIFLLSISSK